MFLHPVSPKGGPDNVALSRPSTFDAWTGATELGSRSWERPSDNTDPCLLCGRTFGLSRGENC